MKAVGEGEERGRREQEALQARGRGEKTKEMGIECTYSALCSNSVCKWYMGLFDLLITPCEIDS